MQNRLKRFRKLLDEAGIEAALITQQENYRYLSGFTGSSAYLLISSAKAYLITDSRYTEQAGEQAAEFEVVRHSEPWEDTLAVLCQACGVRQVGFEQDTLSVAQYRRLETALEGVALTAAGGLVEKLRTCKDSREIALIKQAVALADRGFTYILDYIRPGRTEKEIADELEFFLRRNGAEGPAFPFIVASGPRSALPHAAPTSRVIQAGEQVKLDFGAIVDGYHSDITRTVFVGKATDKFRQVYESVLEAQRLAEQAAGPGKTGGELDAVARNHLKDRGYGDYFGHGLGHGVGLAIHEGPRVSVKSKEILLPGAVFSVEPGVYLPDWGGVRIEDLVLVTSSGNEVLTGATRDLLELPVH